MGFKVFLVEAVMTGFFVAFVLQIVKHNGAKDMPVNGLPSVSLFTPQSKLPPVFQVEPSTQPLDLFRPFFRDSSTVTPTQKLSHNK